MDYLVLFIYTFMITTVSVEACDRAANAFIFLTCCTATAHWSRYLFTLCKAVCVDVTQQVCECEYLSTEYQITYHHSDTIIVDQIAVSRANRRSDFSIHSSILWQETVYQQTKRASRFSMLPHNNELVTMKESRRQQPGYCKTRIAW